MPSNLNITLILDSDRTFAFIHKGKLVQKWVTYDSSKIQPLFLDDITQREGN